MKLHASYKPFYHCGFVEIIISWVLNTDERLFTITFAKREFYKRLLPKFSCNTLQFTTCLCNIFSCQLRMCTFPFSPSMHMSLLSKKYSFFNPKCSQHPEVHCLRIFLQGHCRRINKQQICYYTFRFCSGINVISKKSWSIHEFKYFSYKLCKYND